MVDDLNGLAEAVAREVARAAQSFAGERWRQSHGMMVPVAYGVQSHHLRGVRADEIKLDARLGEESFVSRLKNAGTGFGNYGHGGHLEYVEIEEIEIENGVCTGAVRVHDRGSENDGRL